jgi:phosphoglucosamine mutase
MSKRYFGTDGIRGRVGEAPITPDFLLRLGWAAGRVFESKNAASQILIGKDTRISGYMLESLFEAGLTSAGADVRLLGPMPTPAVAYLTRTLRADAGIVISASHNPFYDNGVKFFDASGNKLADEVELAIEAELDRELTCVSPEKIGKVRRIDDARGRYIEFCKATVDRGFRLHGLKIVLDCAHGATYDVAPRVFDELGANVVVTCVDPDGLNINDHCGSTDTEQLCARVRAEHADLGIAFDGDGDRVLMVDEHGDVVDGDELVFIIARHRRHEARLVGGVVGTVLTNFGLERALGSANIPFVRAKVGDRYVLEELKQRSWQLGGETSGHIVCLDLNTTGDGIVSALQVLVALVASGGTLSQLRRGMAKVPQTMVNVRTKNPGEALRSPVVSGAVKAAEHRLASRGRVLLRPSGTEPVLRVMVEGDDGAVVEKLAHDIASAVRESIGAA